MKRRMLLVGFLAVFVPLVVLLLMQYRWLASLERTSAIAEKAWLNNYLEAVSNEVDYFYRSQVERALNIPEGYLGKGPEKFAYYFRKKAVEGAKYLFVAVYENDGWSGTLVFDPAKERLVEIEDRDASHALYVALSPWKVLAHKGVTLQSHTLRVDEKDPENRIILNPITDDRCQVVGVAGMIIDNDHFREHVLQAAIEKSLPTFFDQRARENLIITVRDGNDAVILGPTGAGENGADVTRSLSFVFSDWTLGLGSRYATPEQWAKSNFLLNISMSVFVGVVLLGGIVLALRTASREMKLSEMKSDFVSNVSHELRTPLASIRVFGEFLRLGRVNDEPKIREYGEFIETESRRLTQLINNILDFSKIESGAKTYGFEETDLEDLVAESLRNFEVSLRHQGFRLDFVRPAKPLPRLAVDPDAITQALANLVDNAVKYSRDAKQIRVSLDRQDGHVVIAVQDHGIGISKSEQKKIFERFHRVGTGLVHDVKGSGLGLSIVNHIVDAHGGSIRVESEPGAGSTFFVRLPIRKSEESSATAERPTAVESVEQLGKS